MAFQPTDVNGCCLWLNPDTLSFTHGSGVNDWADSSPSGNGVIQPIAPLQPVFLSGQINGKPAIEFNSSALTVMSGLMNLPLPRFSTFCVFKSSNKNAQTLFGNGINISELGKSELSKITNYSINLNSSSSSGWGFFAGDSFGDTFTYTDSQVDYLNRWVIRQDRYQGDYNYGLYRNGLTESTGLLTATSPTLPPDTPTARFQLGFENYNVKTGSAFFSGMISEVIIYNRNLTNGEADNVVEYLKHKYFINSFNVLMSISGTIPTSGVVVSAVDMSITSIGTQASGVNFSTISTITYNSGITLSMVGSVTSTSGFNMVTTSFGTAATGVTLYTTAGLSQKTFDLVQTGFAPMNSGVNLSLLSFLTSTSGLDLYTYGTIDASTKSVNMYMPADFNQTVIDMNILGHTTALSGVNMFTMAASSHVGSADFYTAGATFGSSFIPLYLRQEPQPGSTKSLNMFTYATTNSQLYKSVDLNILGGATGYNEYVNLMVKADTTGSSPNSIPLYLKVPESVNPPVGKQAELTVCNTVVEYVKPQLKLFTKGLGGLNGGYSYYESLLLYLGRPNDGSFNMFLKGAKPSSGVNLYTYGVFTNNNTQFLSMLGGSPVSSGSFTMTTKGPATLASGLNMVVTGKPVAASSLNLYTHGF